MVDGIFGIVAGMNHAAHAGDESWAIQARTRRAPLVSKQKLFISNYRSKLNKVAQAVKNMPQFVDFRDDREWSFLAFEI